MDEEKPGLGDVATRSVFGPSQKEAQQLNKSPGDETPLQRLARSRFGRAIATVLGIGATSAIPTEAHTPSQQIEQQVSSSPTADTITVGEKEYGLPQTEIAEIEPTVVEEPELLFASTPPAEWFQFYSEAKVGQTAAEPSLSQLPNFKSKTTLTNGDIEYRFSSALVARDHRLITAAQGQVILKQVVTAIPETWEHPETAEYLKRFGEPEETLTGHAYYGQLEEIRLYWKKGVILVSHPAGEVNELLVFQPTTKEAFLATWGSELGQLPHPPSP